MSAPRPDHTLAPVVSLRSRRRAVRSTALPKADAPTARDPWELAAHHSHAATLSLLRAQQAADVDDLAACDDALDEARQHLARVGEALGVCVEAPPT